jgi:hypothetical protein
MIASGWLLLRVLPNRPANAFCSKSRGPVNDNGDALSWATQDGKSLYLFRDIRTETGLDFSCVEDQAGDKVFQIRVYACVYVLYVQGMELV